MALKRFSCRTHGGVFEKEAKRGRQPVRCTDEYPCDKAVSNVIRDVPGIDKVAVITTDVRKVQAGAPDFHSMTNTELKQYARENFSTITKLTSRQSLINAMERQLEKRAQQPAQVAAKPRSQANGSLPLAKRAKERLTALGWTVQGRAWVENEKENTQAAQITASRGTETLVMTWVNGVIVEQTYALESLQEASAVTNDLPGRDLKFNPDELTDRELVQRISGMPVMWWNSLANSTEKAIISADKVSIEHIFVGGGDEDNTKRLVKFVDHNGGGFRAFHIGALMKVG